MELIFKQLEVKRIPAAGFVMSPLELKDYLDFEVKRLYFISQIKAPTSAHCHLREKELFVMVAGGCTAEIDRGRGLEKFPLSGPTSAIYVGNFVWHHFKNFSPDAILLALSSTNYKADRSDYIEDYGQYRQKLAQMGVHAAA